MSTLPLDMLLPASALKSFASALPDGPEDLRIGVKPVETAGMAVWAVAEAAAAKVPSRLEGTTNAAVVLDIADADADEDDDDENKGTGGFVFCDEDTAAAAAFVVFVVFAVGVIFVVVAVAADDDDNSDDDAGKFGSINSASASASAAAAIPLSLTSKPALFLSTALSPYPSPS
jgi:hypothetical protein